MSRNKLKKFKEVENFENVFQRHLHDISSLVEKKLQNSDYQKLILELGCGKGEYTVALARRNPRNLYCGIDIQGERIWKGAKTAINEDLENLFWVRAYIDNIEIYFPENSVDEIWITFPDPFPKRRKAKKRLTYSKFLTKYRKLLKPNSFVNLKTDSPLLYKFSLKSIKEFGGKIDYKTKDIDSHEVDDERVYIKTYFEKKHREAGKTIKFIRFTL